MSDDSTELDDLLARAGNGDSQALAQVFGVYRHRLKRMVLLRLDRRLHRRVDASDVVQDAFLDASRRLEEYSADPRIPLFLWIRMLTGQRLIDVHRHHLGAKKRAVSQELSLHDALPRADLTSLSAQFVGKLTGAGTAVQRGELQALLEQALNTMDELDREILALRHFEMLSNVECAQILNISTTAASNRYIRALNRVRQTVNEVPGLSDYYDQD